MLLCFAHDPSSVWNVLRLLNLPPPLVESSSSFHKQLRRCLFCTHPRPAPTPIATRMCPSLCQAPPTACPKTLSSVLSSQRTWAGCSHAVLTQEVVDFWGIESILFIFLFLDLAPCGHLKIWGCIYSYNWVILRGLERTKFLPGLR